MLLSILKFQPQEFPLEKQAPSPARGEGRDNSKENLFWTRLFALDRHKMQKRTGRFLSTWPHLDLGNWQALSGQRGLGRAALPFSPPAPGGEGMPGRPQGPGLPHQQGSLPLTRDGFGEEATGRSFQSPEMQFSTPGKVTSPGARPGVREGGEGGGGAAQRTKGPQDGGLPALDLGSPPPSISACCRGKGLAPGQGRAPQASTGRGVVGDGGRGRLRKKTQALQSAPWKPAFQLPPLLREPGPGAAPIHCTHTPNSKVAWMHEGKPPPFG